MADFGAVLLVAALVAVWALTTVCRQSQTIVEEPQAPPAEPSSGWNPPQVKPPQRGRFMSRVTGKPHTESLSTYWNGEQWVYMGGDACYIQEREWRELPTAMVESIS